MCREHVFSLSRKIVGVNHIQLDCVNMDTLQQRTTRNSHKLNYVH